MIVPYPSPQHCFTRSVSCVVYRLSSAVRLFQPVWGVKRETEKWERSKHWWVRVFCQQIVFFFDWIVARKKKSKIVEDLPHMTDCSSCITIQMLYYIFTLRITLIWMLQSVLSRLLLLISLTFDKCSKVFLLWLQIVCLPALNFTFARVLEPLLS